MASREQREAAIKRAVERVNSGGGFLSRKRTATPEDIEQATMEAARAQATPSLLYKLASGNKDLFRRAMVKAGYYVEKKRGAA